MAPPVHLLFPGQTWDLGAAVECAFPLIPLARKKGVDAIFAYNDVCNCRLELEHRGPREAMLLAPSSGFDGSPLVKAWRPAIAHVDLHIDILSMSAARVLGAIMRGEAPPSQRTIVRPTFVIPQ